MRILTTAAILTKGSAIASLLLSKIRGGIYSPTFADSLQQVHTAAQLLVSWRIAWNMDSSQSQFIGTVAGAG
jgi:hypothetical protein